MDNRWLGSFFIAIAVVVAAFQFSGAWKKSHPTKEFSISVTGLASQDFESDLIVWNSSYSRTAPAMKDAYEQLKHDAGIIKAYIKSKGVNDNEVVFSSVDIQRNYKSVRNDKGIELSQEFTGYTLTQSVKIESHDIDKIEQLSREVTELIDQGVELYSRVPEYYYTKLADLKIKMLAAATADARTRAEQIATNAKSTLGKLRDASMGIFQITGENSDEGFESGGAFNTNSKMKTASITVRAEFTLE
ncbi:MAG TPA: SIMPL domain-containing protein [Candidatus Kapabacteria bacterium]|nr:SIMPL domain-containing protein [Candidatus Kapabacteria bacterium]